MNWLFASNHVEYMNGDVTTKWEAKHAADRHPTSYNLKYIEVHNEVTISVAYDECIKKFARAVWEVDHEMHIAVSNNINSNMNSFKYEGGQYVLAKELFNRFIKQDKADNPVWDQGRIHYTSYAMWFMPSAYIDEEIGSDRNFNGVEYTNSNEASPDVTAKLSDDGKSMQLCVVNFSDSPKDAVINLKDFACKSKVEAWIIGGCDLNETNTYENQNNIIPVVKVVKAAKANRKYSFPKYSYTIITLKNKQK